MNVEFDVFAQGSAGLEDRLESLTALATKELASSVEECIAEEKVEDGGYFSRKYIGKFIRAFENLEEHEAGGLTIVEGCASFSPRLHDREITEYSAGEYGFSVSMRITTEIVFHFVAVLRDRYPPWAVSTSGNS